jgi:hypothetical protein
MFFRSSKIHVNSISVVSSLSPFRWCHSSGRRHRTTVSCHIFFPLSKMSSLASFYLSAMLRPVVSSLKPKLKHWIHTTAAGHPSRTARLPPFTTIKNHLNLGYSLHHSIASLFCLLPSQSTTSLELHPPSSFLFPTVPHPTSIRTMTLTVMNYPTLFRFPNNLSACEFM